MINSIFFFDVGLNWVVFCSDGWNLVDVRSLKVVDGQEVSLVVSVCNQLNVQILQLLMEVFILVGGKFQELVFCVVIDWINELLVFVVGFDVIQGVMSQDNFVEVMVG